MATTDDTFGPARVDLTGEYAIIQGENWFFPFGWTVSAQPAPMFAVSSPYVVGNYVTPTVSNGYTYLVVTAGTSAASEPTWPTVLGGRVTSNTAVFMAVAADRLVDTTGWDARATWKVRAETTQLLFASVGSGKMFVGFDPPKWTVNTAFGLGQQVVPTVLNGWVYECVAAGTSHASTQPTWPTTSGAVVTDGTVTWRNVSDDLAVSNIRIALAPIDTQGLASFTGQWDLEVVDTFARVRRLAEGDAVLSPELTTT